LKGDIAFVEMTIYVANVSLYMSIISDFTPNYLGRVIVHLLQKTDYVGGKSSIPH
jgi:hypothetical protein